MYSSLAPKLKQLAALCPYPLYVVGGRVRDFIAELNTEATDTDICAPASVEDFSARARECGFNISAIYRNTGTVKLDCGEESYEFTSFRSDEYVRGEHSPANVFFTDDITLDARRRDFKCNAIYYDISAKRLVDPLGGIEDIRCKRLSTVAPPQKVFGEDGLRLMRLARIAAQTGFIPTESCLAAAKERAELICDIPAERIYAELNLILQADLRYGVPFAHYKGMKILKDIGVLKIILPELTEGEGIGQRKDFHNYDVLEHSLKCVAYSSPPVRLAALLHDIGKPYCFKSFDNFVGHAEWGAKLAADALERLKAPKRLTAEVCRLIETHMYDFDCRARESKVRRFIVENYDIYDKILMLKQADFSACKDDTSVAPTVEKFRKIHAKMVEEGVPFTLKQLNIRGNRLLSAGIAPQKVGDILKILLFDCAIGQIKNEEEALLARSLNIYANLS